MSMYDRLTTSIKKLVGFAQAAITTPASGASIPLAGVVSLAWVFVCNAYTSGTISFKIQVSSDNTNWVDLDPRYIINGGAELDGTGIVSIGMNGTDIEGRTHARLVTVGTVVLSGSALALIEEAQRA